MATTYVLGAGASFAYRESRTGVRPPLARDFFRTYAELDISEDFHVRVGDIVNFVRDRYGIPRERFNEFNEDAEAFMTLVDGELNSLASQVRTWREAKDYESAVEFAHIVKVYDQMIFLFAHVLNSIQQGPPYIQYCHLAGILDATDTVITFNWDTLFDRALHVSGAWQPDWGYDVTFRSMFEEGWRPCRPNVQESAGVPKYLKLHGSINWLVNYVTRDLRDGSRGMVRTKTEDDGWTTIAAEPNFQSDPPGTLQMSAEVRESRTTLEPIPDPSQPDALPVCFISGKEPYATYKNLYREGYVSFSYFFPPNNEAGLPTMPLIVPPTRVKLYQEFAHVLDPLWTIAETRMSQSDRVVVIGFSFPDTDKRVRQLFEASRRSGVQQIIHVVNPSPASVVNALVEDVGYDPDSVKWLASSFDEYLGLRGVA
jgi:hypothetical protein